MALNFPCGFFSEKYRQFLPKNEGTRNYLPKSTSTKYTHNQFDLSRKTPLIDGDPILVSPAPASF